MGEQLKDEAEIPGIIGLLHERFDGITAEFGLEVIRDHMGRDNLALDTASDIGYHTHRVTAGSVVTLLAKAKRIDGSEEAVKIVMTAEGHVGWLWDYECEPV